MSDVLAEFVEQYVNEREKPTPPLAAAAKAGARKEVRDD
jgi:hypothetical protein